MKSTKVGLCGLIAVTVAMVACGDDSQSSDDTVVMQVETTVPAETSTVVDTTVVPQTTAPADTMAPMTTAAPVPAPVPLPAVKILGVSEGSGSGEAFVRIDKKPEGWAKFNVSMRASGGDSARTTVLAVQDGASEVLITVNALEFFDVAPLRVSVSWVNDAGVKSEVASFVCEAGITRSGC